MKVWFAPLHGAGLFVNLPLGNLVGSPNMFDLKRLLLVQIFLMFGRHVKTVALGASLVRVGRIGKVARPTYAFPITTFQTSTNLAVSFARRTISSICSIQSSHPRGLTVTSELVLTITGW